MEKLNFNSKHMTYGFNKVKQHMDHMTYVPDKYDEAVDNSKDLRVSDDYRKLHIYHAKRLGVEKFNQLASVARQEGKNPGRYFTWLLKHNG